MKEFIIETVTGQKRVKSRVKAESMDNMRARIIKEGILDREEKALIYTTNAKNVTPATPFKKTGVIWYDGFNGLYYWMNDKGIARVVGKNGKLSAFRVKE